MVVCVPVFWIAAWKVDGMDPVAGLTTPNLAEAETNRTFLAHAQKVIVVADHTKWRTVGLCTFGPLSAVDVLVTDDGIDQEARAVLGDTVGELILAPVGAQNGSDGRDLTVASFDDPSRFVPKHHFGAESIHRACLNTEGLTELRTADYPKLVDKWTDATGSFPG